VEQERDRDYAPTEKGMVLATYLGKHKRITAQEAAHLLETGERNARKILAAACRVLSMDYNGFTDYWELVDGDNG
jgi:hypothetical protein